MKSIFASLGFTVLLLGSGSSVLAQVLTPDPPPPPPSGASAQDEKAKSIELFLQASKVFKHPRCLNCHPAGDTPTQGVEMRIHDMNVQRGPKDHGNIGMQCSTCHGTANNRFSSVPGAPKWGVAPKSMAWVGLSDKQLCETLKDQKKNHGMSLEKFIKHNAEDELVGWAWHPGPGREPAPGTQAEFGRIIAAWVGSGAHCPEN